MEALVDQYLEWKAGESEYGVEMDVDTHNFEITSIYTSSEFSLLFVQSSSYIYSGRIWCFLVMLEMPWTSSEMNLPRKGKPRAKGEARISMGINLQRSYSKRG